MHTGWWCRWHRKALRWHAVRRETIVHSHAIRMGVLIGVTKKVGKSHTVETLLLGDRAILMSKEESLEVHHFFPKGAQLRIESLILSGIIFHLGLEASKPLLLPLTTLESGNPADVSIHGYRRVER
jgi:hypothetical protein